MPVFMQTETLKQNPVLIDQEMLQGTWVSVSGRRQAELLFAGHHFTMRFLDGDLYMGTFTLNPERTPKVMEMRIEEGPPNHQGKVARCLYDLAPDSLRWCAPEPDSNERLERFPSSQDRHYLSLLFRRELPQQKE